MVLADRAECRRILREENLALMCGYMLMHFIASEGNPLNFLKERPIKLEIRDMRPEDTSGKGDVHYTSWQETYSGLVDGDYLAQMSPEKCRDIARKWPENTLVAALDGKIVGFACYGKNDAGGNEIYALYVLKQAQGLGIGRKLMNAAIKKLGNEAPVSLWVLAGNDHAIGFYEHYGFRLDGARQEILLGTTNTELRMVLRRR